MRTCHPNGFSLELNLMGFDLVDMLRMLLFAVISSLSLIVSPLASILNFDGLIVRATAIQPTIIMVVAKATIMPFFLAEGSLDVPPSIVVFRIYYCT